MCPLPFTCLKSFAATNAGSMSPRTPDSNSTKIAINDGHIKITRLRMPPNDERNRSPILKDLRNIPRLPEELKLAEPENWATWSSLMIATADLLGFDVETLEEHTTAVHIPCKHHNLKTAAESREGKMLGLLIKFNISLRMNDLVSLTMDGYEVWQVLKLYCARFADTDPTRVLRKDGGCIRIS